MPLQRLIGTQAFLPALLARIRAEFTSSAVPLENVIFQSILLCLVAGNKHLILRTPEEDIAFTVKLVVWVRCSSSVTSVVAVSLPPTWSFCRVPIVTEHYSSKLCYTLSLDRFFVVSRQLIFLLVGICLSRAS
jgi:hypothetical protein